jgi:hypothetical protein
LAGLLDLAQQQAQAELLQSQLVRTPNQVAQGAFEGILSAGGTPESRANSDRRGSASDTLLQTLAQLGNLGQNPIDNTIMQSIERSFTEGILADIGRQSEAGGSSANALSSLLQNDAQTRLAEAQANQALSTVFNAAQGQAQVAGALQPLTATDPVSTELIDLLGLSGNFQDFANIQDLIGRGRGSTRRRRSYGGGSTSSLG